MLSKDFLEKSRPKISREEAMKDIEPVAWIIKNCPICGYLLVETSPNVFVCFNEETRCDLTLDLIDGELFNLYEK